MSKTGICVKSIIRRRNGREMVIDGRAVYGGEKRLITVSSVQHGNETAVTIDGNLCCRRTMKTRKTVEQVTDVVLRRLAREQGLLVGQEK
jgi:hypothetical protein